VKIRYRVYTKPVNIVLKLMVIVIFVFSSIFTLSNIFFISVTTASDKSTEWQITLNISEPDNASDTVTFGEKNAAAEGQDQYDIPKPPAPQEPYIRSWFTTSLDPPYNTLWEEYRALSDKDKVWNLTIIWISETSLQTDITISWDISGVKASDFDSINLHNTDTINMMKETNYRFTANTNEPYNFQIITKNKTLNETSDTNGQPLLILTIVIILIILVIIYVYFKKIKK